MTNWLKIGYFTNAREDAAYWLDRSWISDSPGRVSPWWDHHPRPAVGDVYPPRGPQYEVGDHLVIYLTGSQRCVAIMRVSDEPEWNPGWVDDHAIAGEGDRWGVITEVDGLWALDRHEAPTLAQISSKRGAVQRNSGRLVLTNDEFMRARKLIARDRRAKRQRKVTRMPIEEGAVDEYQTTSSTQTRTARRREHRLMRDYQRFMERRGDVVSRWRAPVGSGCVIICDAFNETREQLIEAKSDASRADIRVAIGQLADYGRFKRNARRAVLLNERPSPDLRRLLQSQEIASIWRDDTGFVDDADGDFTL